MRHFHRQLILGLFGWLLLAGLAGLTGCQTADQADSGDLASVQITGHTDAEIQQAAARVFLADGFQQVDALTFDKPGTSWDKIGYGGWSSNPVWIRVRLKITPPEVGQAVLSCDAFRVVDRNEVTMEEEKKISNSHGAECKKILDQVKAMLDSSPDTGAQ
jgi:hypothetical protein